MRKKQLMAMPVLDATPDMVSTAVRDRGSYKKLYQWQDRERHVWDHDWYFRAVVQDGILKVAMFSREDLVLAITSPRYEIYIDREKEDYLTYDTRKEKWREARISYLDDYKWLSVQDDWEEPGARKKVNDYLQNGEIRIYNAIDKYQCIRKNLKLHREHQAEKDRIDAVMDLVPPLPKDWEDWIYKSAYSQDMYLIYRAGEDRAWCTCCGKETTKKDARHGIRMKCPNCHKPVIARAWAKQKTMSDTKRVGILQKLKDGSGFCLTVYNSRINRFMGGEWKVDTSSSGHWPLYRFILDNEFRSKGLEFEYGNFKQTGEIRWCREVNHGGFYYGSPSDECVLYSRNLKKLRKGTVLKYIPIEDLYANCKGDYAHIISQLSSFKQRPGLEYLLKLGLYHLVWGLSAARESDRAVSWSQKKPWKALGITKETLGMCIRMDITLQELKTLQKAQRVGTELDPEQIRWYSREFGSRNCEEVLRYGHPGKFMNYMVNRKIRAVDYVDYLEELKRLRIPRTQDVLFPKDFQSAHERMSQLVREKESELEKKKIEEKDRILQGMLPELSETYLNCRSKDFVMVIPTCKEDFNREGRENHNCVGGSYYDKMLKGKCVILFLRKADSPDKAFCTVEMDGSRVVQCRAVRNSEPPEEVREFMEKYSQEVEKRLKKVRIRITA